jgi:amino acid transporter
MTKGVATAICYTLGYALDIPDKAISFAIYMSYWIPDRVSPLLSLFWIFIFIWPPLIFNYFNVRKFGEIEFTLTSLKIFGIWGIIILGFVIVGGGTGREPLLATDANFEPIPCSLNSTSCLGPSPGFICEHPYLAVSNDETGNNSPLATPTGRWAAGDKFGDFWAPAVQLSFATLDQSFYP